jgi:hypothetical protein
MDFISFLKSAKKIPTYTGTLPHTWYGKIQECDSFEYPKRFKITGEEKFTREGLRRFLKEKGISNKQALIAILAWGNCKIANGKTLFEKSNDDEIDDFIKSIKSSKIKTREQAFDFFIRTKKAGKLKGLGVSFFTKVLWFLRPDLKGYILDQFTAKSVNLIHKNTIRMTNDGHVNQNIKAFEYECYCISIENIAKEIKQTPEITEEILFGGDYPEWRKIINQKTK